MDKRFEDGDRVRHQDGWLATVTHVGEIGLTVIVKADDPRLSGEWSITVFEEVTDE